MNSASFNYDAFFGDLDCVSTLSSTATSSPSTETDGDSGIACTPPMNTGLDNTVIDIDNIDIWPWNMDSPLSNDPKDDLKQFSALFDDKNPLMLSDDLSFDNLFSDFEPTIGQSPETNQQLPLSPVTLASPNSSSVSTISQLALVSPSSNAASMGPTCVKLEALPNNPHIKIVKAFKPLTLSDVRIIQMPSTRNGSPAEPVSSMGAPPAKRQRSRSPTHQETSSVTSTVTLDQLKAQYGNVNEEALKKHLRMIKNRESASQSRKRRKELMENLDVQVKDLNTENEQLKRENSKLLIRIHTLEIENELLKTYKRGQGFTTPQARKPLILMGIVLLVVFNIFTLKSLSPGSTDPSGAIGFYNGESAVVPSRAILSARHRGNDKSYSPSNEHDYGPTGNANYDNSPSETPSYPYVQCVAYINKTHSKRINQDLHSWVQDHHQKQQETKVLDSVIIPDSRSLTLPSDVDRSSAPIITDASIQSQQHIPRKVALHNQRQTKDSSDGKGQLQPYKTYEANQDDFIHTLDRKNDTLYFVSFKRDHLIFPATTQNQTGRPKMSLILPASMANLNKSIHIPANHVPMIKIDCEVEDTKFVFVKRAHIPSSYRQDLFQYYSAGSPSTL